MVGSPISREPISSGNIYDDGCLRIELENFYICCRDQTVKLTRGDFLVLSVLVKNMETYVSFERIWTYLWGEDKPLNIESLKVHVSRIRQRLGHLGIRIENKINCGYKLTFRGCN